jgi:hypothetical protein
MAIIDCASVRWNDIWIVPALFWSFDKEFPMHSEWSLNNRFQPCAWFSGHIGDTRAQLG